VPAFPDRGLHGAIFPAHDSRDSMIKSPVSGKIVQGGSHPAAAALRLRK